MDIAWQQLLGLNNSDLSPDFRTEHFTNQELNHLLKNWGGGNVLNNPEDIGKLSEKFYEKTNTEKEFFNSDDFKVMWRDGLGRYLNELWIMISEKKLFHKTEIIKYLKR